MIRILPFRTRTPRLVVVPGGGRRPVERALPTAASDIRRPGGRSSEPDPFPPDAA